MIISGSVKRLATYLASVECAVLLFLLIAVVAIPGTFSESRAIYKSPFFLCLLAAFGLNLLLCSLKRIKNLSRPVLVLHGGVLLTLVGCIATSFGFVATSYVYEGHQAERFYRWDTKQDSDLGFALVVDKINRKFTPVPVKVGVLMGESKKGLHVLKTGESFMLAPYRVVAEDFELPAERLKLSVYEGDHHIGTFVTSGSSDLPLDFPYQFRLVAFQTPLLLREWVALSLVRNGEVVAQGTTEVNHPFLWNGLFFYNTRNVFEGEDTPYAGIQIVRDPGRPVVFTGFAVIGLGAVLSFRRRIFRKA